MTAVDYSEFVDLREIVKQLMNDRTHRNWRVDQLLIRLKQAEEELFLLRQMLSFHEDALTSAGLTFDAKDALSEAIRNGTVPDDSVASLATMASDRGKRSFEEARREIMAQKEVKQVLQGLADHDKSTKG